MNIFLNEYFGFCFELNFELNHFSARFNEKMNFQNVSHTPSHNLRLLIQVFNLPVTLCALGRGCWTAGGSRSSVEADCAFACRTDSQMCSLILQTPRFPHFHLCLTLEILELGISRRYYNHLHTENDSNQHHRA